MFSGASEDGRDVDVRVGFLVGGSEPLDDTPADPASPSTVHSVISVCAAAGTAAPGDQRHGPGKRQGLELVGHRQMCPPPSATVVAAPIGSPVGGGTAPGDRRRDDTPASGSPPAARRQSDDGCGSPLPAGLPRRVAWARHDRTTHLAHPRPAQPPARRQLRVRLRGQLPEGLRAHAGRPRAAPRRAPGPALHRPAAGLVQGREAGGHRAPARARRARARSRSSAAATTSRCWPRCARTTASAS